MECFGGDVERDVERDCPVFRTGPDQIALTLLMFGNDLWADINARKIN